MNPAWAAAAVAGLHVAFIAFVVAGGLVVLKHPKLAWVHIPAVLWGSFVEIAGRVCPLTHWENHYLGLAGAQGYDVSFVERYLLALIYPEVLLGRPLPDGVFAVIGLGVLAINAFFYWRLWRRG